jgi:hypothetical protein
LQKKIAANRVELQIFYWLGTMPLKNGGWDITDLTW